MNELELLLKNVFNVGLALGIMIGVLLISFLYFFIKNMKIDVVCPKCKRKILLHRIYCFYCGTKLKVE